MGRLDELLEQVLGPTPSAPVLLPPGHTAFVGHEPADTEGTQSFSVASGIPLDQRTSFVVGSVIVDNNTSAWINVPDATKDGTGRFVAPGQGASFPVLGHISRARINWLAPPGKVQPAFVAGEQAVVVFAAAPVPPGFGFAAPVGTAPGVEAFPLVSRNIGTYNFDVPAQSAFRGIVCFVLVNAGGGTVAVTIADRDPITGIVNGELISNALGNPSSSRLLIYPGVSVLANFTASLVITPNVRLQCVVAVAAVTFQLAYYLLP